MDTAPGPCTLVGYINPNDAGDPVTSPAPGNGVIVRFRMRTSAAEAVTFRLATVTKEGDTILAQAVRSGSTVMTAGTGEIEEFQARLVVHQGEHIALDAPAAHMVYNQGGDEFTPLYAPPLVEGQGPRGPGSDPTGELLVQAVMEPDADGDGFGDETQDGCPTQSTSQGACDTTGPGISGVAVEARAIRYRLSEAATLTVRVQRARKGRRVRGQCRRETSRNRNRPRCIRYVSLRGRFTDAGEAGSKHTDPARAFPWPAARAGPLSAADHRARRGGQRDTSHENVCDQEKAALAGRRNAVRPVLQAARQLRRGGPDLDHHVGRHVGPARGP